MADVSGLEADHIGAQVGKPQPQWHLALEDAALATVVTGAAFAGDDEHEPGAVALGATQEAGERRVRLVLGLAVQVEASIDCLGAACQALLEAAVKGLERRHG